MAEFSTHGLSFHTGVIRSDGVGLAIMTDDELASDKVEHSLVAIWSGGDWQRELKLDWSAISAAEVNSGGWVIVGSTGKSLFLSDDGKTIEGQILTDGVPTSQIGLLKRTARIGKSIFAFGMCRQVYRLATPYQWERADSGVRRDPGDKRVVGFNALCGTSEDELYGAGWKGEIWACHAGNWHQVDSPTNIILTAGCIDDQGQVYIVGRRGVLIRGRHKTWEIIDHQDSNEDFWDVTYFAGCIYISSMRSLYQYQNGRLRRVAFDSVTPSTFYHLSGSQNNLWSIGPKDLFAFDGQEWRRLVD